MKHNYKIVNSFYEKGYQVITLDRIFESFSLPNVEIDGKKYPYTLNSVKTWVVVKMGESIKSKEIRFVA